MTSYLRNISTLFYF